MAERDERRCATPECPDASTEKVSAGRRLVAGDEAEAAVLAAATAELQQRVGDGVDRDDGDAPVGSGATLVR